ncbi:MAG TPA: N-acetylmuramoyl-L-alanine amidase [Acetobacteraceae bacterium]|nr:N-acetylmuramoyl-L-alanine amidase [Acetobacteraceae bacterium]
MLAALLTRRLLLGRAGSGLAVVGTFLLPRPGSAAGHKSVASPATTAGRAKPPAPLVMLDPGHGGKDPGAIGVSGTYEKNVALATAFELQRLLEWGGRYRVLMTRTTDRFVPLEERVARAQEHGATLFVSMHADALNDHSVRGASVYTLAPEASDAQTAQLAARENSADRFAGPGFKGVSPEVARILASLVQRETRVDSVRLANRLVSSLDHSVPMLPNPERHAGFVVLKSADIPSVLVEMGFMSNPRDEAELRQPQHRAQVARAMRDAVDAYFASRQIAAAIGIENPA